MPVARTLLFGEQGSTKAARPCRRFPMQMFLSFFWIKRPRPCLFRPYRQGSGSLVFPLFSRPAWEFPGGPFAVYRRHRPRGLGNPSRALFVRNEAKHPALPWCRPKDPLWVALFFHSPPRFDLRMKICAEQKSDDQNENIKANNRQVKDAESILPYRSE